MAVEAEAGETRLQREWWLRALAVLVAPRAVFAALREEAREDLEARQEPLLAIVYLAGIAGVLASTAAGRLFDDPELDGLLVAVWAFIAGGVYGFATYFVAGAAVYMGARGLGGLGSYRRARHVLAFAAVPFALSLLLWPFRLAVYGGDVFRSGGSDAGAGGDVFTALALGFAAWSLVLLAVGVKTVHGWSWGRAIAALGLVGAVLAAFAVLPALL
jgi:hypothetical protein